MPRVSRRKLPEKDILEFYHTLSSFLTSLHSQEATDQFLTGLLTAEEKIMLSKRLIIFILLSMHIETKTIQETLHVSYETIRTYKSQFIHKNEIFKKEIRTLAKREELKKFMTKLDKILAPIDLALQVKRSAKARAKLINQDYD
jgi:Trp operon repressor